MEESAPKVVTHELDQLGANSKVFYFLYLLASNIEWEDTNINNSFPGGLPEE